VLTKLFMTSLLLVLLAFLSACGAVRYVPESAARETAPTEAQASSGTTAASAADTSAASAGVQPAAAGSAAIEAVAAAKSAANNQAKANLVASGSAAPAAAPIAVPARAAAEFARAVGLMRGGDATAAQLEFQVLTQAYPELPGPYLNLGILHRKAGRWPESETALRAATERAPQNALAWTELGAVLRARGQFADARGAYERAIAADANFAPAHRNLGVLLDLYLNDSAGAQAAFETYKTLTGEDKPVSGWIAELKQRNARAKPAGEGG
jgi:tetratricopeptide (TPR) repeat protein